MRRGISATYKESTFDVNMQIMLYNTGIFTAFPGRTGSSAAVRSGKRSEAIRMFLGVTKSCAKTAQRAQWGDSPDWRTYIPRSRFGRLRRSQLTRVSLWSTEDFHWIGCAQLGHASGTGRVSSILCFGALSALALLVEFVSLEPVWWRGGLLAGSVLSRRAEKGVRPSRG